MCVLMLMFVHVSLCLSKLIGCSHPSSLTHSQPTCVCICVPFSGRTQSWCAWSAAARRQCPLGQSPACHTLASDACGKGGSVLWMQAFLVAAQRTEGDRCLLSCSHRRHLQHLLSAV